MSGFTHYAQFALALAFVLSLIGGLAVVARRLGWGHAVRSPRNRRLALVEVMAVDARRRLVLVRRDRVEHLLLIGPTGEQVVETGIVAAGVLDNGAAVPTFAEHLSGDAAGGKETLACLAH